MSKQDICLMFACIQPSFNGSCPSDKKYFRMLRMCLHSLLQTGFPKDKILPIVADEAHVIRLKEQFGINALFCSQMPSEFKKAVKRHVQNYFFYKPMAFYHAVPKPLTENTVMSFCDVDVLFKTDPTNLILSQITDVWSARGTALPRNRNNPPSRYYNPERTYEDLSEYFYMAGNGAIAHLLLKYDISLPKEILYSAFVAIKPYVYEKVISKWYEMCLEVMVRDDLTRGDQEVLSAAIWHLNLSFVRSTKKFTRKIYKQYGGLGRKSEMMKDFKKRFKKVV